LSLNSDELLKQIEKDRYLIPCKCKICNKSFKDVLLGTQHVYDKHPKREIKNVVDNLSWNIEADLKKWEILQILKIKRDKIINKLNDERAIEAANIPSVVEIQRKKADISGIMQPLISNLEKAKQSVKNSESSANELEEEVEEIEEDIDERDFEGSEDDEENYEKKEPADSPDIEEGVEKEEREEIEENRPKAGQPPRKRKLCDLLEREVEKYLNAIKRLNMSSEVEKLFNSRKKSQATLDKYMKQLDYFLGVAKAARILKTNAPNLEIII